MADETVQIDYEFFDYVLFQVELAILTDGWSDNSFTTPLGAEHRWDLERAIEHIARLHAEEAFQFNYPELAEAKELCAEMKAYLSTLMPKGHWQARAKLSGFNDSAKTHPTDVFEVLELAREKYRRPEVSFRERHNPQGARVSNQHVYGWLS